MASPYAKSSSTYFPSTKGDKLTEDWVKQSLNELYQSVKKDLTSIQLSQVSLQTQIDKINQALASSGNIAGLTQRVVTLETELDNVLFNTAALQTSVVSLNSTSASLLSSVSTLSVSISTNTTSITLLNTDLTALQLQVNTLADIGTP